MDKPQRKWLVRHAGDHGIYDNTDDELFDVVERGEGWLISIATNLDRDTARLIAAVPELAEAMARLITAAKILLANAEGCAANHYGDDMELHGPPGWLADCANDIESARAALSKALGEGQEDNG